MAASTPAGPGQLPPDVEEGLQAAHSYIINLIQDGYNNSGHAKQPGDQPSWDDNDQMIAPEAKTLTDIVQLFKENMETGWWN